MELNKKEFKKMQAHGFPAPRVDSYDTIVKEVSKLYDYTIKELKALLIENYEAVGLEQQTKNIYLKDAKSLKAQLKELKKSIDEAKEKKKGLKKLEKEAEQIEKSIVMEQEDKYYNQIKSKLETQLRKDEKDFFNKMIAKTEKKQKKQMEKLTLEQTKKFSNKIKQVRAKYIKTSLQRIQGENNNLKKNFLVKITDFLSGKQKKLNITKEAKDLKKTAESRARFFARDQLLKFNKSLLVETYKGMGAKEVKVITVGDNKVRNQPFKTELEAAMINHRHFNKKILKINSAVFRKYQTAYNCRCFFEPVYEKKKGA